MVLETVGNQSELARRLGVVKQLVSRWEEIPPQFAIQVADLVDLQVGWILPELEARVIAVLGYKNPEAAFDVLLDLIPIFITPAKSGKKPRRRRK